jgi:predicted phage terminase large subunit-like protein
MSTRADKQALLALLDEKDRRRACADFTAFYRRMTGYEPPPHIRKIGQLMQAMEEDRVDRAMLFAPPRHAKTTCGTILMPAWIMGRHPSTKIMSVVHTARYGAAVGRKVRNLMLKPEWPFLDVHLAEDSKARDQWATPQGGEYNAFGAIGGNQHGNPAEWLFMDDLVKGRKVAMSPHMRDEVWETYKTDLVSRLEGRFKQLMVFTRWHQDDPAGRILPSNYNGASGWHTDRETGERWYVLSLPAVSEGEGDPLKRPKGEWLWPERFGEDRLGGRRRRGGWQWSALYQQRPSPEEGLMFQAEHIKRYDPNALDPLRLKIYISSDYAVTDEAGSPDPDYTVHQVWGVDPEWNLYLLDMWRGRTLADEWVLQFVRLVKKWKPLMAVEEGGQIIKSVGPFLTRIMQEERAFVARVQINSSTSKEQRAHSLLGMAAMGRMFFPDRAKCSPDMLGALDAFEAELLQFPTGKHDDTVDAATLFGRFIDQAISGSRPRHERKGLPQGHTLDDLWSRHDAQLRARDQ